MQLTLSALLALGLTGSANAHAISKRNSDATLKGLASKNGKYFGTATQSFQFADKPYRAQVDSQFSAITPENEMKWEVIEPTEGNFNWTGADLIFAEAEKIGAIVRGHNFCWDSQTPEYVTNITDPSRLKKVLKNHINAVMDRYGDRMAYMDVVNEPLNENGTYKSNVWYNVLGEQYIEIALNYAHEANSKVKLCINDYNNESINNKSLAYAAIAKDFVKRGVPLDCVGFESHFIGGSTPSDIAESMEQFTSLGLEVPLTELDIRISVINGTQTPTNATEVGKQTVDYYNAVTACLDNKLCPGITIWQHTDKYSWIPDVFQGEGSALPYNEDLEPKAALYAITEALTVHANAQ